MLSGKEVLPGRRLLYQMIGTTAELQSRILHYNTFTARATTRQSPQRTFLPASTNGCRLYHLIKHPSTRQHSIRVLKRLRHVAMALKNSVPNKLAFRSKWPRYLSHRCFLSSQTKRNRLKREKITFTLIMWRHLITTKEFYEEFY